jgi:DNA repair exonuclease SbcCD ATPase subunit
MEKIVKDRTDALLDSIKHNKTILTTIGNPRTDIIELQSKLAVTQQSIEEKAIFIAQIKEHQYSRNEHHTHITSQLNLLETNSRSIIDRRNALVIEVNKLQGSITEYTDKRKSTIVDAGKIKSSISEYKRQKDLLVGVDFSYITKLNDALTTLKEESKAKNIELGIVKAELEELQIPMPDDGTCKHCRQILTPEHRTACIEKIESDKTSKSNTATALTGYIKQLHMEQSNMLTNIKQLEQQQKQFDHLNALISGQENELGNRKRSYNEYDVIIKDFNTTLTTKQEELTTAMEAANNASEKEIEELRVALDLSKKNLSSTETSINTNNNQMSDLQSQQAIILHSLEEKNKDVKKLTDLNTSISKLENDYVVCPFVIQAFSSIPDLIIESVIQGLEEETNKVLVQMRPDLRLEFATEKTKTDGTQDDTLDINYYLNNKPRDYMQLSGGQQLCVMFAFKLGLSFLLAKMNGSQIKFLMLDEVDMPFSHAAVDAYADIIRIFQKDFVILVITHNDRMKTKFSNAILVQQDGSGASRAKVVSSW